MKKRTRGRQRLTQEEFLEAAREKHGSRYDYSLTVYRSSHEKITILCPEHGSFEQKAFAHLLYGCRRCANDRSTKNRRTSVESFIDRAGKLHQFKYDYRDVVFDKQHDKVAIICPAHGVFHQAANDHLKGHGCVKCASQATGNLLRDKTWIDTSQFIERSKKVHGDRYDYTDTIYQTTKYKVAIRCFVHGEFLMLPTNHLAGYGCAQCTSAAMRENSYQTFLERVRQTHGNLYDYVEYHGMNQKAGIVCPTHGLFYQRAIDHIGGCQCPPCARSELAESLRYTRDEYIQLLSEKFDDHVTLIGPYSDLITKAQFTCLAHGDFVSIPTQVLTSKHGCVRCAKYITGVKLRLSADEFLIRANDIHLGKYRYGTYTRTCDSIEIICPRHGAFQQSAKNHLSGYGCPCCGRHGSIMQNAWLDRLGIEQREIVLLIEGRRVKVDGYDPATNTIYEFYGDFWHGNLRLYGPDRINMKCGLTFGELNNRTRERSARIIKAGYQLIEIWEHDWKKIDGKNQKRQIRADKRK